MNVIRTDRKDEVILPAKDVVPGMVVSPDLDSRCPRNIFVVTDIRGGIIHGIYVGEDGTRNCDVQSACGLSRNVLYFPNACLCLHGPTSAQ